MRVLELFAGAGGMALGLHRAGFDTAALVEWDPMPQCVLRERFPGVPLYGDVAEVDGRAIVRDHGQIDMVSGGSPCQDLSVAGKRAGLEGARSGLFHQQMRIWEETGATYCLWENVCGALSSAKGADFAAVLSAFVGAPVAVPRDGWGGDEGGGGVVAGPTGVAAWRVLDAKYFGVPQRRRRVFVLGARPGGVDPAAVLLDGESLSGDPEAERQPGDGVAGAIAGGARGGGERRWPARIASSLNCAYGTKYGLEDQRVREGCPLFVTDGQAQTHIGVNLAGTLNAQNEQPYIVDGPEGAGVAHTYSTPAIGHIKEDGVASSISANTGGGGETQNPAFVVEEVVGALTAKGPGTFGAPEIDAGHVLVEADVVDKQSGQTSTGISPTLKTDLSHDMGPVVVQEAEGFDRYNQALTGPVSPPIDAANSGRVACVLEGAESVNGPITHALTGEGHDASEDGTGRGTPVVIAFSANDNGGDASEDVAPTLRAGGHKDSHANGGVPVAIVENNEPIPLLEVTARQGNSAQGSAGIGKPGDPMFTLTSKQHGVQAGRPRRLLPIECERLMGWPDNWTAVLDPRGKPMADSHRYKMCGNGVVSHVAEWIGRQLLELEEAS